MKSILIISVILFLSSMFVSAQDCEQILKTRLPRAPYEYSDQSIGDYCETGETYNFNLPLQKTMDYRLKFYASPIFNNKVKFEIRDKSTHKTIFKLTGKEVLAARWSEEEGREIHPFFDFRPRSATTLEIIIITDPAKKKLDDEGKEIPGTLSKIEGCITIAVLQKKSNRNR